jgi:cell division protein FtsL
MIRVLNFFCVATMGLTILALYHVSEQTRVARVQLGQIEHRIVDERTKMSVLQTEWVRVANPERIQQLAESSLNMNDTATLQLSSLELLPRRGDANAPLGDAQTRQANAQAPSSVTAQLVKIDVHTGM